MRHAMEAILGGVVFMLGGAVESRVGPLAEELDRRGGPPDLEAASAGGGARRVAEIREGLADLYQRADSLSYQDVADTYEAARGLLVDLARIAFEDLAGVEAKKWADSAVRRAARRSDLTAPSER